MNGYLRFGWVDILRFQQLLYKIMTKEQIQTEELVKRYIQSLDTYLDRLNKLNGANTGFNEIQHAYAESITSCINKAKLRIEDIRGGLKWLLLFECCLFEKLLVFNNLLVCA